MRKIFMLSMVVLALSQLSSCAKKPEPPPAKPVRVSATKAYERYFGPPPTADKGTCFAFVIYFPSAREIGKVVPFPFFTFDEGSIKKVAVERLLSGMDVGSYKGEFLRSFQPDVRLLGISEKNGTVTVNFSKELTNLDVGTTCAGGPLDAMALTLAQFQGVKEVRAAVEGKGGVISFANGCLVRQPIAADEGSVLEPGPPRLLSVTGVKDKGAKNVEEVSAYFDRPVEVQELSMTDKNGAPFAGNMYHSVFDMAAVLKPKDPGVFKDRLPIKVRWKVTDKMGRNAEGENLWLLEIREH
ncbi:MAG TPA: GerMN domain-containing protein [Geobacteraceae bacterium]